MVLCVALGLGQHEHWSLVFPMCTSVSYVSVLLCSLGIRFMFSFCVDSTSVLFDCFYLLLSIFLVVVFSRLHHVQVLFILGGVSLYLVSMFTL